MMFKKMMVAGLLMGSLTAAFGSIACADELKIDAAHSHANFSVNHVMIERVTGTVQIVSGTITTGPDGVTPAAVSAVLDPRRLSTGDPDRDGDLQGDGWFDTKKFPTWDFKSSAITPGPNGTFTIAGTLTIRGVGQPVTLLTTVVPHKGYRAVTHVDRHAFGMKIGRTDSLVGTDVTINLDIQITK
jgi:polyisoprenoid-binding protein YceI